MDFWTCRTTGFYGRVEVTDFRRSDRFFVELMCRSEGYSECVKMTCRSEGFWGLSGSTVCVEVTGARYGRSLKFKQVTENLLNNPIIKSKLHQISSNLN